MTTDLTDGHVSSAARATPSARLVRHRPPFRGRPGGRLSPHAKSDLRTSVWLSRARAQQPNIANWKFVSDLRTSVWLSRARAHLPNVAPWKFVSDLRPSEWLS